MTIIVSSASTSGTLPLMRSKIQQRGYAADTNAAQDELLNSVYRRIIGLRHWDWLESENSSVPTIAATDTYALATPIPDLLHIDAVRLSQTVERLPMDWMPYEELRDYIHEYTTVGTPVFWSHRATNVIRIWPSPDGVYTLPSDYIKDPPDLVTDADQSLIPAAYEDILVWGAIVELAYRERDWYAIEFAQQQYTTRLNEMIVEYGIRQRQTPSTVTRWAGWSEAGQQNLTGP